MKLIVGTYRKKACILDCINSIGLYVSGWDEIFFLDDSGDLDNHLWLNNFGTVIRTPGQVGFAKAMGVLCNQLKEWDDPQICWWEEDFVALSPVNLYDLADELYANDKLAEVALLRQPWFPAEKEAGGVIDIIPDAHLVQGLHSKLWLQQTVFTTNPSVWSPAAWEGGWPDTEGSEAAKTVELKDQGYWFAWRETVEVHHDGERMGTGY